MDIQPQSLDEEKGVRALTFKGRLDAHSREQVKTYLHDILKNEVSVAILDLSQVPFIDSSGLSALVSGLRVARENKRELVIVGLNRQAQMVFNLTMMDRVFNIFPTVDVALESIRAS